MLKIAFLALRLKDRKKEKISVYQCKSLSNSPDFSLDNVYIFL